MINKQTDLFPYPTPRIDDIIDETGGCEWFPRIDLREGYWQAPLKEETKKFTPFVTPFDIYQYNRLPFGWKNSGSRFQKRMNETLSKLTGKYCNVYVDDIIVCSRTKYEEVSRKNLAINGFSAYSSLVKYDGCRPTAVITLRQTTVTMVKSGAHNKSGQLLYN